jgi:UDP-galactose transporter B1
MCRAQEAAMKISVARKGDDAEPGAGLGKLAMCTLGICGCYLYFGVLQERLFTGEVRMGATFTLVTACLTNSFVALAWQHLGALHLDPGLSGSTTCPAHLNHSLLLLTSFLYVTAMVCSNESIQFVSYPVAVLVKSCKLIPTMLVGQTVEGRNYEREEWMAAILISFGIVLFHYSHMKESGLIGRSDSTHMSEVSLPSTEFRGMALLLTSLLMDGLLSSSQNLLKRRVTSYRSPTATETMLYVNLYALVFLIPLSIAQGQWQEGMLSMAESAREEKNSLLWSIFMINLVVAVGQMFIFLTIQLYSSVVVVTITTTRKFLTILLSVWTFGHHFSPVQWAAISLVFVGLYLVIMVQHQTFLLTVRPKQRSS